MRKTTKNGKKALSLFLSVLMMLTTLTAAIPGMVSAAEISEETVMYNSGIGVQFLTADGKTAVDSVDVNHTYISTNNNVNTVHTFATTGFDTVKIRLNNMDSKYPITVLSVVADKAYIGDSASAATNTYNNETVIAAKGSKDLYIVSPADFNEGGNITYTITYKVDGGKITNICGGNTFTAKAYLYVNPAEQIRHGLHEGVNVKDDTQDNTKDIRPYHPSHANLLSFWYYIESTKGYITNNKLNSAEGFLNDMTVTEDPALADGRKEFRTYDYADSCYLDAAKDDYGDMNNGQCIGTYRCYSDGHAVTYNFYYDVNEVKTWQDAGFRARFQENYLSYWQTGVNLKYLRLASNDAYLNGITGSDKKFSVTFGYVPSVTNGKTQTYSSSDTAKVVDYVGDKNVLLSGKQNEFGHVNGVYEEFYTTFAGNLPTDINATEPAKIMFSPKLNMQSYDTWEDSSYMTTHINLIPYNKTALRTAVTAAEQTGYCSGYYFDTTKGIAGTTYEAYENALANAKAVLGKGATTQADIDAALADLNTAVAGLKALEHNWSKVTYTWAQLDGKWICSATRHCPNETGHDEYAIAEVESNTVPGTCIDESVTTYTATFEEDWATNPPKKVVEGSVNSEAHNWKSEIEYTWSDDMTTCTATKVCLNDAEHNIVSVGTVSKNTVPGTCVNEEKTTYTATFTDSWAETQKETVIGEKADHNWIKTEYTWNADNTECTATRTCDKGHTETVKTTNITSTVVTDPTCADEGTKTYTATFETGSWATTQTKEEKIPVSDHIWEKIEYTWNADNTECTVTRTCTKGHTESETVTVTKVTTDAKCEEPGETKYTADFKATWAEDQTKTETIPAINHDYAAPTYTWSDDNKTCTATSVCKNDSNHIKTETITAKVTTTAGTCVKEATTTYTATFADGTVKTVTVEGALGEHDWDDELVYTWSEDKTTCTATKVCNTDASHNVSETVTAVVTSTAGTCKENGTTTYTATFKDGTVKTVTVEGDFGEHDWDDELVYTWSDDNKTCTATKVCNTDASHNVSETVTAVVTSTAGTCVKEATTTYTATFKDGTVKTVTVEGTLGEHDWADELVYTWSEDNKTCTATKVCNTDASHNVSETVTAVVTSTAGTCKENGTTTYTATFKDGTVKTVTVEGALGEHDWADELVYTWSEDKTTCTATKVCNTDASHNVSETVTAVVTSTAGTCKENGTTTYTATFADGTVKTVTVEGTLGEHDWADELVYTWSEDKTTCTATKVCNTDASHNVSETVTAVVTSTAGTCVKEATTTYTAKFSDGHTETVTVTGKFGDHDWNDATYTWNDDYTKCTATRVCKNDPSHVEKETVEASLKITAPKCEEDGKTVFTATFTKDWAEAQTYTDTIESKGHDWGAPTYTWNSDYTECTATRVCKNDSSHVETETKEAVVVTNLSTCQKEGDKTYTADFDATWAETQTKKETIPALPHKWTITYEWSEDNTTCTATAKCENGHTETETVKVVITETPANCVETGKTTYTADFKADWGETQQKEFNGDTLGGHIWNDGEITRPTKNEDGTWTDGEIKYTCEKDATHTKTEPAKRADYTEYDAAVEKLKELLKDEALTDDARAKIEKALADNAVPDNLIVPEQDLINAPTVTLDKLYNSISGDKNSYTYHHIVFGKTNGIGWYKVSKDGGATYETVFGNSTYEVKKGTEIKVYVGDIVGNSFTFYVNGDAVKPDENGVLTVKVNGYMLIGALGFEVETPEDPGAPDVPDVEESLNWFQRIIKAIGDFFKKIFGIK